MPLTKKIIKIFTFQPKTKFSLKNRYQIKPIFELIQELGIYFPSYKTLLQFYELY